MHPYASFLRVILVIAVAAFVVQFGLRGGSGWSQISQALLAAFMIAAVSAPILWAWVIREHAKQQAETRAARIGRIMFRTLLDSITEGAIIVDEDGRINEMNRYAEELFGYERTELLNQPIEYLIPERYRDTHVTHRDAYKLDPKPRPMGAGRELLGRRRDGSEFVIEISLSPIAPEGKTRVLALMTDVSARRRSEQGRIERRLAGEAPSEAVILITDADAHIVYVNPTFEEATGYTREEVLGQNPRILKSGLQSRVVYEQLWATVRAGQVWRSRLVNRRKDGTLFHQDVTITPILDTSGRVTHYISIGTPVAESRRSPEVAQSEQRQ